MIKSWFLDTLIKGIIELFSGFLELVGNSIGAIYQFMVNINNNSNFIAGAVTFTTAFAIALVSLTAVIQYLDTYVFEVNNDPDADPMNYAIRIAQTTAFISCNGWIFNTLLNISNAFYSDLIGSASDMEVPDTLTGLFNLCSTDTTGKAAAFAIILCALVIAFIINAIVAAKRGGEITLMKIAAPIFFVDLMTTNRERFNSFFVGYVFTFVSYSIQMFCFIMALKSCVGIAIESMSYVWMTFAWLWLCISGPKFLEKYIYKSGVGSATSGGARMAMQTFMLKK